MRFYECMSRVFKFSEVVKVSAYMASHILHLTPTPTVVVFLLYVK